MVARWLSGDVYLDADPDGNRAPRPMARSNDAPSFDALVHALSQDVRPRAVLDGLLRLGLVVLGRPTASCWRCSGKTSASRCPWTSTR